MSKPILGNKWCQPTTTGSCREHNVPIERCWQNETNQKPDKPNSRLHIPRSPKFPDEPQLEDYKPSGSDKPTDIYLEPGETFTLRGKKYRFLPKSALSTPSAPAGELRELDGRWVVPTVVEGVFTDTTLRDELNKAFEQYWLQRKGMSAADQDDVAMANEELTQSILDLLAKRLEQYTHYHRTCQRCGKNWWGLHCPHDGYQNPCPECESVPVVLNAHYCDCDFVASVSEVRAIIGEQRWLTNT